MSKFLPTMLSACVLGAALPSQVSISEISFESGAQWIELVNQSPTKVDLSLWSIYQATKTQNVAQNYWFGFPSGSELAPGKFLRVHWLVPVKPSTPTDIYTGESVFNFLFGLKAEPFGRTSGALALFNTQQNIQMNNPAVIQDWVTWGSPGLKREDLAVTAKKWIANQAVGSPVQTDSLALIYTQNTEPTPASAFFHDSTPTPGAHNHLGSSSSTFGQPCSGGGVVKSPALTAASVPAPGNRDFGFRVSPTATGQLFVLLIGGAKDNALTLGPCTVHLEPDPKKSPLIIIPIPSQAGETTILVPLTDKSITGAQLNAQAAVLATQWDYGFSNRLTVDIGN